MNLLTLHRCIGYQLFPVQILLMHVHSTDLVIVIGSIVVDPLIRITAGSIQGNLVFPLSQPTAPPLLIDTAEDMEKLAYALLLRISG